MEFILAFNTTNGARVSNFQMASMLVSPGSKRASNDPLSKNAYLRGSRAPPNDLPDGTMTIIRCPARGGSQWTFALVHGEPIRRPNGEDAVLLRGPGDEVLREPRGG